MENLLESLESVISLSQKCRICDFSAHLAPFTRPPQHVKTDYDDCANCNMKNNQIFPYTQT